MRFTPTRDLAPTATALEPSRAVLVHDEVSEWFESAPGDPYRRRANLAIQHLAAEQNRQIMAGTGNVFDDMSAEDDDTFFSQFRQQITEPDAFSWIQTDRGFVHHDDLG